MTSSDQLRRQRQKEFSGKQDNLYTVPALIGRPSDSALRVITRPGYIYVRIGHDETLAQAYWLGPVRYDMPCICGYDGISTEFRVLRLRQESYTLAGYQPVPEVDVHGITHLYPDPEDTINTHRGTDIAFSEWRQILELRVGKHTSGNFVVRIERAPIEHDGALQWIVTQTLDLTTSVPSWGARWVLIYLGTEGTIEKVDGEIKILSALTIADVPIPTFSHFRLASVMLWYDQVQIRDDGGRRDIVDLRFPQSWATNGNGNGTTVTTVAVTPRWHVDGPLAVFDEVDGIWRLGQAFELSSVVIYLNDTGSAGATTIDVEKSINEGTSWSTVFPTQANRPSIAGGASGKTDTGTPAIAAPLSAGNLLRMNIEVAATGARGLSVAVFGDEGSIIAEGILSAIMGVGR